jgi:hypothetical protein
MGAVLVALKSIKFDKNNPQDREVCCVSHVRSNTITCPCVSVYVYRRAIRSTDVQTSHIECPESGQDETSRHVLGMRPTGTLIPP